MSGNLGGLVLGGSMVERGVRLVLAPMLDLRAFWERLSCDQLKRVFIHSRRHEAM